MIATNVSAQQRPDEDEQLRRYETLNVLIGQAEERALESYFRGRPTDAVEDLQLVAALQNELLLLDRLADSFRSAVHYALTLTHGRLAKLHREAGRDAQKTDAVKSALEHASRSGGTHVQSEADLHRLIESVDRRSRPHG